MLHRFAYIILILISVCYIGSPPALMAQSKGEGQRLFNEGRQLCMKDKSKEGQQKALQKYLEALTAIRKEGDVKLEAVALNNMGYIYSGNKATIQMRSGALKNHWR